MELFIIALVVTGWMTKVVQDGRTDRAYAKKGQVSPRHRARLARLEASGRPASPKSRGPLRNYLSELYADAMLDLADKHRSRREQRGPAVYDPDRPSFAQRFDTAVLDGIDRVKQSRGWDTTKQAAKRAGRKLVEPVGEKPPTVEPVGEKLPTRRFDGQPETDADRRFFDLRESGYTGWIDQDGRPVDGPTFERAAVEDEQDNDSSEEKPMNTEATTYETAVPALGDLHEAMAALSEHVAGAEDAVDEFITHVEEIDAAKAEVVEAAQLVQEQMADAGVSGSSMEQVTAAMEQVQTGDLASAIDFIGQARAALTEAKDGAAEAASAAGQAQQDLQEELGDAHERVASNLSGNGEFLSSGARG